uniref:Peptidase M13 C-terminal domain-containing protein n=1 Tax=Meloidogyne incognita TaxID=6306 RepID=A0A914MMM6_MELIC
MQFYAIRNCVQLWYGNPPKNNPWLDTITKGKALTKLQMLQANAVYFERIFDNNYLEGIYKHYNPLRTDVPFAEMVHTFEGASFLRQMATNDYYDSSWLVNAYYSRETNALVSLNGYLNPPIFSKDFLAVMNYAGIGVTLGHELSHAFDDWGSYYNGNGQMEDWLGPQMRAIFQKKKECFVKQYGNSKVQIDGVWINLNGTLTVNENIADNGGLNAAFKAWQVLKRSSSSLDQNIFGKIDGLEEFNGDQLFFIHYAFRQCSRLGSTWLRQRIMTEQHSVVPARVNIPLQNSPHFAKIFACPSGSPMNPIEKCAIW